MELIELNHVVRDGLVTYPGLPAPSVTDHLARDASRGTYADGTTFQIGRIEMVANTGTYVDAPFHRFADGRDLADVPLERLANLPGVVLRARSLGRAIDAGALDGLSVRGRAVLVDTGWDRRFGTPAYGEGHPFLTAGAAARLVAEGARLVGIDSLNIDDARDGRRPVHTGLLAADVPIVEHLTGLDRLPDDGFRFFAAPVRVAGMGSFPVRAFAIVDR